MIRILAMGIGRFAAGRAEALPQNLDCKSFGAGVAAVVATVHGTRGVGANNFGEEMGSGVG